jgi:hypothetical protein
MLQVHFLKFENLILKLHLMYNFCFTILTPG